MLLAPRAGSSSFSGKNCCILGCTPNTKRDGNEEDVNSSVRFYLCCLARLRLSDRCCRLCCLFSGFLYRFSWRLQRTNIVGLGKLPITHESPRANTTLFLSFSLILPDETSVRRSRQRRLRLTRSREGLLQGDKYPRHGNISFGHVVSARRD